jgi:hypothetical protein
LKRTITINENGGDLLIEIDMQKSKIVIPTAIIATLCIFVFIYIVYLALSNFSADNGTVIFILVVSLLMFPFTYYLFILPISNTEAIEITKDSISILDKYMFSQKSVVFLLSDVVFITFVGYGDLPKAADRFTHFDNGDLEEEERTISDAAEKGNIIIQTKDGQHRFGKEVPSWDVDEIIVAIEKFTKRNLKSNSVYDTEFDFENYEDTGDEEID